MILFISNSGECLPIAWRMAREGEDVSVYLHDPRYRHNYDGMIEKIPAKKILGVAKKSELVIFDITRINEFKKQDRELLKLFNARGSTVFGPVASVLKKHSTVIGCSTWTEELEMDRAHSMKIAKECGMNVPESREFGSLEDGVKFLQKTGDLWVFKPHDNMDLDMTYVERWRGELIEKIQGDFAKRIDKKDITFSLQKVITGTEISTEGWFDGERWLAWNHTIEDKRLMTGNLGPAIGSQGNTVWVSKDGRLLRGEIKALTPHLKKAGYIGPVDVNSIVAQKDNKPYFLEFSPRFGYDAIYNLLNLLQGKIVDFFRSGFSSKFHDGFSSSQRVTIPPFPYCNEEDLQEMAKDVVIQGVPSTYPSFWMEDVYARQDQIRCAGSDGIIGVMCGRGDSIPNSVKHLYRDLESLRVSSYLQWRIDGGERATKAIKQLRKQGIQV
jgi:phosphoribosylamine-glycine ligase